MNSQSFGAEIESVYPGWTASEYGYFYTAAAHADTAESVRKYRLQGEEVIRQFAAYRNSDERDSAILRQQLDQLANLFNAQEAQIWAPGFGIFAGIGLAPGGVEATIGVGYVKKIKGWW